MNKNLKAFGRIDAQGRLVAGSVVYRLKKPTGDYIEVQSSQCCNFDKTLTFTTEVEATYTIVGLRLSCNGTRIYEGNTSAAAEDYTALKSILLDIYPMLGTFTVFSNDVVTLEIKESLKKSFCPTGIFSFEIVELG